ncbi:MAG: sigma-E factor negative regulatory protein [Wenzhouxiangellaceae bacterium]
MDRNNEPISALADDELDPKGAEFLIRRLFDDQHLHQHWQRLHLVRACLQREFSGPVSLVGRVRTALEDESAPERGSRFPSLMRIGVGGALAASVTMVAVLGLANRMGTDNPGAPQHEQSPGFVSQSTALDRQFNAPVVPAGFGGSQDSGNSAASTSATQQRINRYMIRHSQAAGDSGFISLTPVLAAPAVVRSSEPDRAEVRDQEQAGNP